MFVVLADPKRQVRRVVNGKRQQSNSVVHDSCERMEVDPVGLIVTVAVFVVSIPIAFFVGRRNRQVPDLRSALDFDQVLSPGDWLTRGDLDITYNGQTLERVSRTYIALWNQRGDTVRRSDILATDPLRITIGGDDEILQTRIVSQSRQQIGVQLGTGKNEATVTFDFLDKSDGFIIEVMHKGDAAALLEGTVLGALIHSPKKLAMTQKSRYLARLPRYKRFPEFFRGESPAIYRVFIALNLVVPFGLVYMFWAILRRLGDSPVAADYDLSTQAGQHDFARAVINSEPYDSTRIAIPIAMPLMWMSLLALVAIALRPGVPRQIVLNDSDPPIEKPSRESKSVS